MTRWVGCVEEMGDEKACMHGGVAALGDDAWKGSQDASERERERERGIEGAMIRLHAAH